MKRTNFTSIFGFVVLASLLVISDTAMAQRGSNRNAGRSQPSHATYQRTRTVRTFSRTRTIRPSSNYRINPGRTAYTGRSTFAGRPSRFVGTNRGPRSGNWQHFRPSDWRRNHPDWDGHLYFHGGYYYYDPSFTYVADLDNEWTSIAAISGGVALLGSLTNDPYLEFAGGAGALYSLDMYNADLYSSDPALRLRAEYFTRPFFWRDGVRYDRHRVDEGGRHYYQFVRH